MLINELGKWLSCRGGDQIAFFENFSPPKAFYYDLPKLRNFQESPTPPPPPPFRSKMKIMGENQMRKLSSYSI